MAEWAHLPEELFDLIISKLFDLDRYNFRLVCRSWNEAAAVSTYPFNAPCLIHYDREKLLWGFFQYKSFFYRSFPELDINAEILCSKYGWLLMRGKVGYFFFNPFNGYTEFLYTIGKHCYTSTHFFHPPTSPDCFIIGIVSSGPIVVDILRYGQYGEENGWRSIAYNDSEHEFWVSNSAPLEVWLSNSAPILHHGLLYFVGMRGEVATLDIEHGAWTMHPKSLEFRKLRNQIRRHYLLKINGDENDDVYAIFMIHDRETVNVFRLVEPEMKWERVRDLGDKMLYVSLAWSFGDVAKPKSMANTICFPIFDGDDDLLFYSLKTQKYHSFRDANHSLDNSFGLTNLHYGVTWINPQQFSMDSVWYPDNEEYDSKDEDGIENSNAIMEERSS